MMQYTRVCHCVLAISDQAEALFIVRLSHGIAHILKGKR